MRNKKQNAPYGVENGVENASQITTLHSNCTELLFKPETLEGFIKSVTMPDLTINPFAVALGTIPLYVAIDVFGDQLTSARRRHLIGLREEIEHWMNTDWRRLSAAQLHERQRRNRESQLQEEQLAKAQRPTLGRR